LGKCKQIFEDWQDLGSDKLGKCKPIFDNVQATNPNQHIPNGLDDPLTTINYHHMDKDDGMG
jgi:hypothetical protein